MTIDFGLKEQIYVASLRTNNELHIRIGCSNDVKKRLKEHNRNTLPFCLKLEFLIPGDYHIEQELHKRLKETSFHNKNTTKKEWYIFDSLKQAKVIIISEILNIYLGKANRLYTRFVAKPFGLIPEQLTEKDKAFERSIKIPFEDKWFILFLPVFDQMQWEDWEGGNCEDTGMLVFDAVGIKTNERLTKVSEYNTEKIHKISWTVGDSPYDDEYYLGQSPWKQILLLNWFSYLFEYVACLEYAMTPRFWINCPSAIECYAKWKLQKHNGDFCKDINPKDEQPETKPFLTLEGLVNYLESDTTGKVVNEVKEEFIKWYNDEKKFLSIFMKTLYLKLTYNGLTIPVKNLLLRLWIVKKLFL